MKKFLIVYPVSGGSELYDIQVVEAEDFDSLDDVMEEFEKHSEYVAYDMELMKPGWSWN